MSSTTGPDAAASRFPGDEVGVDRALLENLGTCYALCRHALTGPFDPVKTLSLTGGVLESVSSILTATRHARGLAGRTGMSGFND